MRRLRTCLHDDPGDCAPKVPEVLTRWTKVPPRCLRASDGAVAVVSNQTLGYRAPATEAAAGVVEVDPAAQ